MSTLDSALKRLLNEVNDIVGEVLNDAFPTIDVYIEDNMNLGMRPKAGNFTDKLYVNTGRLKRSFTVGASESIQELKVGSNGVELRYGTNVPYAVFNELGTKHIKARPFLAPSVFEYFNNDIPKLEQEITERLIEVFK